ncbi:SusD/RagB family nutrient-binding outer membrane lipoprotein [Lederbergia lenta]|uniref:SusD/RagB family nutrient-binding outer membrane lipoprotein n=1 Tax=Lederbergia lenta TaxID=1467 RepID=UPI00203E184A|nr:SusD/RagB family nutrient-binding outer membrane lipoprotein [Lederbergia lenta]MCM3110003.1 SusD/RagB family nutrient-binding outer membrane lipoprotein [Lederbergia lenta]
MKTIQPFESLLNFNYINGENENFNQLSENRKNDRLSDIFGEIICTVAHKHYGEFTLEEKSQVEQRFFSELDKATAEIDNNILYKIESIILRDMLRKYLLTNSPLHSIAFTLNDMKGERVTIFKLGGFGFPVSIQVTMDSALVEKYAQYSDSLKIVHRPKRKRSLYSNRILPNESIIIYNGWIDIDLDSLTNNTLDSSEAVTVRQSKYMSFDNQYLTDILNYVKVDPIVKYIKD